MKNIKISSRVGIRDLALIIRFLNESDVHANSISELIRIATKMFAEMIRNTGLTPITSDEEAMRILSRYKVREENFSVKLPELKVRKKNPINKILDNL